MMTHHQQPVYIPVGSSPTESRLIHRCARILGPASGRERIVSRSTQPRPDLREGEAFVHPHLLLQMAACRQLLAMAALADSARGSRLAPATAH